MSDQNTMSDENTIVIATQAWVVSAEMGYGHLRAVHPFASIAASASTNAQAIGSRSFGLELSAVSAGE